MIDWCIKNNSVIKKECANTRSKHNTNCTYTLFGMHTDHLVVFSFYWKTALCLLLLKKASVLTFPSVWTDIVEVSGLSYVLDLIQSTVGKWKWNLSQISLIHAPWREDPKSLKSFKCFWLKYSGNILYDLPKTMTPLVFALIMPFPSQWPFTVLFGCKCHPIYLSVYTPSEENCPLYDFLACSHTNKPPHL